MIGSKDVGQFVKQFRLPSERPVTQNKLLDSVHGVFYLSVRDTVPALRKNDGTGIKVRDLLPLLGYKKSSKTNFTRLSLKICNSSHLSKIKSYRYYSKHDQNHNVFMMRSHSAVLLLA